MKHTIICIKNNNEEIQEILPGYIKPDSEYNKNNVVCWNCCHECVNIKHIPIKHDKNIFYVYGTFCSDGCSHRYLYDNYRNKDLWEKIQLIKFYYKELYGKFVEINPSPPRLLLKMFGGDMDIDEYRDRDNNYQSMTCPPIVILGNIESNNKIKDTDYLKLYRKKKAKNIILNSLK